MRVPRLAKAAGGATQVDPPEQLGGARGVRRSGWMSSKYARGWREPRARASSASALLSVVFFLRARYIFASFVFIE